jgi:predicted DNA-binding antitoxin AbrB/MazE fold protein
LKRSEKKEKEGNWSVGKLRGTTALQEKSRGEMGKTIKARFFKGVIEPLEKLDYEEGREITVTIIDIPSKAEEDAFRKAAGSWKGKVDAEKLIKNIYADRLISTRPEVKLKNSR